jgi:AcrR family transcriptional regulator
MPRVADHDERRRQVAAAVAALIADDGLDGVTVARTAATAGMSVGLVQHYFSSKDEMLLFTFTQVRERIVRRATVDAESANRAGARIEHIMCDALSELLPTDEQRRRECRVATVFTGRAADNPRLAETLRASNEHLRTLVARAIHNGKECGEVPADTAEQQVAARLLAALDGLVQHAFLDPAALPPAEARAALAEQLRHVFPGPCERAR